MPVSKIVLHHACLVLCSLPGSGTEMLRVGSPWQPPRGGAAPGTVSLCVAVGSGHKRWQQHMQGPRCSSAPMHAARSCSERSWQPCKDGGVPSRASSPPQKAIPGPHWYRAIGRGAILRDGQQGQGQGPGPFSPWIWVFCSHLAVSPLLPAFARGCGPGSLPRAQHQPLLAPGLVGAGGAAVAVPPRGRPGRYFGAGVRVGAVLVAHGLDVAAAAHPPAGDLPVLAHRRVPAPLILRHLGQEASVGARDATSQPEPGVRAQPEPRVRVEPLLCPPCPKSRRAAPSWQPQLCSLLAPYGVVSQNPLPPRSPPSRRGWAKSHPCQRGHPAGGRAAGTTGSLPGCGGRMASLGRAGRAMGPAPCPDPPAAARPQIATHCLLPPGKGAKS